MVDSFLWLVYFLILGTSPLDAVNGVHSQSKVPTQVHLAYAGRNADGYPTGMRVAWFTYGRVTHPVVEYGLSEDGPFPYVKKGVSNVYLKNHGQHHVVTITGLKPGTKYYYRCGNRGLKGQIFSEVFNFRTPGTGTEGFKLSVVGDHGYLSSHQRDRGTMSYFLQVVQFLATSAGHWDARYTRERLVALKDEVQFFWLLGDIGYADDALLHTPFKFRYEDIYNGYMTWMQELTAYQAFQVVPGNHESECHSLHCLVNSEMRNSLRNFTAYNARFHMPYAESDSSNNMWYSFNYGLAHFVGLNTETDFPGAAEETRGDSGFIPAGGFGRKGEFLEWLEADLAKADAERHLRPWVIVGGHRPLYEWIYLEDDPLVKAVEDLFMKYHVDMYLCGHKHTYFRTLPVYRGEFEPDYHNPSMPVYVIPGSAGNDESILKPGSIDSKEELQPMMPFSYRYRRAVTQGWRLASAEVPGWLAATDDHYSVGTLHVANRTTLTFTLVASSDGSIIDEFSITKEDKYGRGTPSDGRGYPELTTEEPAPAPAAAPGPTGEEEREKFAEKVAKIVVAGQEGATATATV
mmetsp:Transcript_1188/g.2355  ORF Transcript_1188/g.2355 Transcript_1188/m.2355 type:complete len:575 (-) Transcript_1188:542-2266(-)|eukprot:CAMPEP_0118921300 /NCGR_PEP_ID=MMETSP1169-20130426/636_1 /TAXON_ID=36882 /ORGANISM="Pyramimonas obovata, Strain CCMP722" /LENGTH=574 /DNA_ID=CAMNT_0006862013 /DNA_START=389 /DNA_END=2113 /DNA_ORIENTATION=+